MLNRIMKGRTSDLDEPITKLLKKIEDTDPTANEYPKLVSHLEVLTKLRDKRSRGKVSPDTMFTVIGNVLIVVLVIGYERGHVMVTRALNFTTKTKS